MSQAELQIVISPEGHIQIEVQGVQGNACMDLTRTLEEALGSVEDRQYKPEYYVNTHTGIQNQQY